MTRFTLAANNGEIGGGEVMLLRTAKVLRQLGHEVTVVAPALADGVGAAAAKAGFATVAIKGQGRKAYMRNLPGMPASVKGCCGATGMCPPWPPWATPSALCTYTRPPALSMWFLAG